MIDLHFHCLPGIDDGPNDWTDAVALCRAAAADGVTSIVATPHVLRDRWLNDDPAARHQLLVELNRRLQGTPVVLAGCEFFFTADLVDFWTLGTEGPLTSLNNTRYLLVEFPANQIPAQAEGVFHELSIAGARPVIAHPERNLVLASNPDKLARLVELGALTQITAGSLIGAFGKAAQSACDEFFQRGLVHLVASDAHSVARRPPQMTQARERVRRTWSADVEAILFEANPRAVLENESMPQE